MTTETRSTWVGARRFFWWLLLGTASLAGLVALQWRQSQYLDDDWKTRADSATALTFQFEREFLRLRHTLDVEVQAPTLDHTDELALRYNIFVSRKALLEDNPSTQLIRDRAEYRDLLPRLDAFIKAADPVFADDDPSPQQLPPLLSQLNDMGPKVQALSLAATSVVAHLVEAKQNTIREQGKTIVSLTVAQLALLFLAAFILWKHHLRLLRERVELERLTEELQHARRKAEAASEGKSRFLANMSHELRTPFNGMLGMLSMLESTPLNEQQSDYARTVRDSAQHLLTLLNDILDVSAMEVGKLVLKPEAVELRQLLRDTETLMQISANDKQLTFAVHNDPTLPHWIDADPTRLKQILFNLLSNAIKFTERGRVTMSAEMAPSSNGAPWMSITVTDTGIGMDEQSLDRLFQRFYQVDSGADRRFGGVGLGLDISRTLARLMGGDLTVKSRPDLGSSFTLSVPLTICMAPSPPALPTEMASPQPTVNRSSAPEPDKQTHAWRIMVAEDHPVNRKVMGALLGKLNCAVTFCENGQEAVDAVASQIFDLVFMDIHMPVMDGLAATRLIRQRGVGPQTLPIIALTADVMNEARENAQKAGLNEFLTKPIRLHELEQAIARWLPANVQTN